MRLTHRELSAVGGAGAYGLKKALELEEAFGQARARGGRLVRKGVTTTIEKPGPASSSIDIAFVMHLYLLRRYRRFLIVQPSFRERS